MKEHASMKVFIQELWYIFSGLDIQLGQLGNPEMTILHTKNWFKVAEYDESYTAFLSGLV